MDMNIPVSPIVLHAFYTLLFEELIGALVIAAFLFFIVRKTFFGRRINRVDDSEWSNHSKSFLVRVPSRLSMAFGVLWIINGLLQAQPAMSNEFVAGIVEPIISALPGFLPSLLSPPLYLWSLHPLFFDSLAVWLQIAIGIGIIFGPFRRIGRGALYVSIGWSLVIWVFGEAFGSILNGATWLTGAPGSALIYALVAVLLLQPMIRWNGGQVFRAISLSLGVMWLGCALLQALPSGGFWQEGGIQGALLAMAQMNQPAWMSAPISFVGNVIDLNPALWNALFIAILLGLGLLWLMRPKTRGLSAFTILFTLFTWWLGQDFGVVGGMGTDPNTGAPLLVLLVAARRLAKVEVPMSPQVEKTKRMTMVSSIWTTIGVTAVMMVGTAEAGTIAAATDAPGNIKQALNDAGLTPLSQNAPNVTLTNQNGQNVSLSDFRGKVVLLTFLDPVCYDDCPVTAQEMIQADKLLGPYANDVEMVAVAANPLFHSVKDIQRFDAEQSLTSLSNWTYLTSSNLPTLEQAWQKLYEYVSVPKLGMVDHGENLYFISPEGREVWLAQGNSDLGVSGSYASFMATYIEKLLHVSPSAKTSNNVAPTTYHSGLAHPKGFDTIHMIDANNGWATAFVGTYSEVLRTTDGGKTWQDVSPIGISQAGGLMVGPTSANDAVVLVPPFGFNKNAALFQTTDGGKTWLPVGFPGPTPQMHGQNQLSATPDGALWLTGTAAANGTTWLYKSTDHGATWQSVGGALPNEGAADAVVTGPITWATNQAGRMNVQVTSAEGTVSSMAISTENGGQSWQQASTPLLHAPNGSVQTDFISKADGWAIVRNQDKSSIWRTENGGTSWVSIASDSGLSTHGIGSDS